MFADEKLSEKLMNIWLCSEDSLFCAGFCLFFFFSKEIIEVQISTETGLSRVSVLWFFIT